MESKVSDDENGPAEYDDSDDEEGIARDSVMSIERQSRMLQQQNHQNRMHHHDQNIGKMQSKQEGYFQVQEIQAQPIRKSNSESADQINTNVPQVLQIQQINNNQVTEEKNQESLKENHNLIEKEQIKIEDIQPSKSHQFQQQALTKQQIIIAADAKFQIERQAETQIISNEIILQNKQATEEQVEITQKIEEKKSIHHQRQESEQIVPMMEDSQINSNQQPNNAHHHNVISEPTVQEKPALTSPATDILKEKLNQDKNQQSKPLEEQLVIKEVEERKEFLRQVVVQTQKQGQIAEPQQIKEQQKGAPLQGKKVGGMIPLQQQKDTKKQKVQLESQRVLIQSFRQKPTKQQQNGGHPKGCQACEIM